MLLMEVSPSLFGAADHRGANKEPPQAIARMDCSHDAVGIRATASIIASSDVVGLGKGTLACIAHVSRFVFLGDRRRIVAQFYDWSLQRKDCFIRSPSTSPRIPYADLRVGRLMCHSVACSYACARASIVDSANGDPLIWRPIGRPEFVRPQGTVMAGMP